MAHQDLVAVMEQLHHRLSRLEALPDFEEYMDLSDGPVLLEAQEVYKTDDLHHYLQSKLKKVMFMLSREGYEDLVLKWTDDLRTQDSRVRRGIARVFYDAPQDVNVQVYVNFDSTRGCFAHIDRYKVSQKDMYSRKQFKYVPGKVDVYSASELVSKLIEMK